jgi:cobalt-zinc-cadmium efflux system membrane fusion protein
MKTAAAVVLSFMVCAGCSSIATSQNSPPTPPARVSGTAVKESDLGRIILTAEAENRLGIRVEESKVVRGTSTSHFAGAIVEPPGSRITLASSVAGTVQGVPETVPVVGAMVKKDQPVFAMNPLVPLPRDLRITAEADLEQARTRLVTARSRKARADKMLADEVGTVRAQEDAQLEVLLAESAVEAAEKRLRHIDADPLESEVRVIIRAPRDGMILQVFAVAGQTLNAGAPMFEVSDLGDVWIRTAVYAGEVSKLAPNAPVVVQALSGTGPSWTAQPVTAPPSADPASSTVHLYYRLPNAGLRFKPGEKFLVTVPSRNQQNWAELPWSAVVFDIHGGSWVYESLGDRHYARRRVEIDHTASGRAYLTTRLPAGLKIVAEGAAELWGFEFGTGK